MISEKAVEAAARALWSRHYGSPAVFDRCITRGGGDTGESQVCFDRCFEEARIVLAAALPLHDAPVECNKEAVAGDALQAVWEAHGHVSVVLGFFGVATTQTKIEPERRREAEETCRQGLQKALAVLGAVRIPPRSNVGAMLQRSHPSQEGTK